MGPHAILQLLSILISRYGKVDHSTVLLAHNVVAQQLILGSHFLPVAADL